MQKNTKERINTNISALPKKSGGNYDEPEDTMKIHILDCIIDLLKTRKEYKEALIQQQENQKNRAEKLKLFGLMGM